MFARAVFLPASYTSFGGWVSILTYAMATGLPLLLAAEWGAIILRSCPDVRSIAFGKSRQCIVLYVMEGIINSSNALLLYRQALSLNDFAKRRYGK